MVVLFGAVVVVVFTVVVVSVGAVVVVVFTVVVVSVGAFVLVVTKGVVVFVVPVGVEVVVGLVVVVVLVGAEFEFPSLATVTEGAGAPDPLDEVGVDADSTVDEVVVALVEPGGRDGPEDDAPAAPLDDWARSVPGNEADNDAVRSEATATVAAVGG